MQILFSKLSLLGLHKRLCEVVLANNQPNTILLCTLLKIIRWPYFYALLPCYVGDLGQTPKNFQAKNGLFNFFTGIILSES